MSFCEEAITPANILATVVNYVGDLIEVPTDKLISNVNSTIDGDFDVVDVLNSVIGDLITIVEDIEEYRSWELED